MPSIPVSWVQGRVGAQLVLWCADGDTSPALDCPGGVGDAECRLWERGCSCLGKGVLWGDGEVKGEIC